VIFCLCGKCCFQWFCWNLAFKDELEDAKALQEFSDQPDLLRSGWINLISLLKIGLCFVYLKLLLLVVLTEIILSCCKYPGMTSLLSWKQIEPTDMVTATKKSDLSVWAKPLSTSINLLEVQQQVMCFLGTIGVSILKLEDSLTLKHTSLWHFVRICLSIMESFFTCFQWFIFFMIAFNIFMECSLFREFYSFISLVG